jgi:eukaryotic-like serine/threonine-protein kinase
MSVASPVAGRYQLIRPLGHGAMAVVDLAQDIELDRPVALKRLAENLARDEDLRQRFLREARLAARLSHPNVVRVFDVGEDEDRPFIAMEYVERGTVADLLARRGPLPGAEAATLGVQACTALAAAHAAGLVHRDVKPQNLLLGSDGVLKLGDFGIAAGHDGTRLTLVGTVLGTAGYLAPEQARGEEVTAAADIYAVGAVLYELLTGELPRGAASLADLGAKTGVFPPDVARRVPAAPVELIEAVTECLSVRPEDRPPSAAALARRLAAVATAQTLPLPADPGQRATEILAPTVVRPSDARRARRRPVRTLAMAAALVAAAAAGLVIAVVLASGGNSPRTPSAPHAVNPPQTGTNPVEGAQNLASWIRAHSG